MTWWSRNGPWYLQPSYLNGVIHMKEPVLNGVSRRPEAQTLRLVPLMDACDPWFWIPNTLVMSKYLDGIHLGPAQVPIAGPY